MSINDDLLPEMIPAPPKPEPNIVQTIEDPDFPEPKEQEVVDEESGGANFIYSDSEGEEEIAPEPTKRVIIPRADIFKTPETNVPVVQKVKQKRKPRGPASEKQLEALARARAKGAETRRKKADEKKQIKEMENQLKQQEMDDKKKSLQRKLRKPKVIEEVDDSEEEIVEPKRAIKPQVNKQVVEDTIEKAVSKGIAEYEMKRKERKKEKQERIAKEQHDKKILNTVSKAINPDEYWAQCFQ
tara:strand:+ start:1164 stop:1889 length:726 start_codon:yes stop_codon:yes gene_type:complete